MTMETHISTRFDANPSPQQANLPRLRRNRKEVINEMSAPKIRVVLVSHGEQSKGMLNSVQMLLGPQENIAAYSIYPEQPKDDLVAQLRTEVEKYGAENIIFMTELKNGTPFNSVVELTRDHDVYHITGTNLAMLMTVIMERDDEDATLEALCEAAMETAQDSIADVRKMLSQDSDDEEEDDL